MVRFIYTVDEIEKPGIYKPNPFPESNYTACFKNIEDARKHLDVIKQMWVREYRLTYSSVRDEGDKLSVYLYGQKDCYLYAQIKMRKIEH